jgi:hypothetical protein
MTCRGRLSTFALALTGIGMACDWGPSEWPPEGTVTVSGTVTEVTSAGVAPIRGIRVFAADYSTTTNSSGRYNFFAVKLGTRTFRIEAGPFETVTQTVNVTADSVVDFRLVRRPRFTLSGFVTEDTPSGPIPLAGIDVDVELCPPQMSGGWDFVSSRTDARGFYSVPDMCDGRSAVFAALNTGYSFAEADGCNDGHGTDCRWITIAGDTRFDFRLVKQERCKVSTRHTAFLSGGHVMTDRYRLRRFVPFVISVGMMAWACHWGPSTWPPEGTVEVSRTVTELTGTRPTAGRYLCIGIEPGVTTLKIEVAICPTPMDISGDTRFDFRPGKQ